MCLSYTYSADVWLPTHTHPRSIKPKLKMIFRPNPLGRSRSSVVFVFLFAPGGPVVVNITDVFVIVVRIICPLLLVFIPLVITGIIFGFFPWDPCVLLEYPPYRWNRRPCHCHRPSRHNRPKILLRRCCRHFPSSHYLSPPPPSMITIFILPQSISVGSLSFFIQ